MNSTGRPRIPFALMSLANSSAARRAWMPYWALLPGSAAGIPILIGPWADPGLRYIGATPSRDRIGSLQTMHLTVSRTRLRRSHVACRSSPSGRLSPGRIGFEHTTQRGASVMACSEKRASLTIADFSDPCHDLPQSAQVDRRNPRNRAASRAESAILGPVTFHDILARRAAAHPDREALVDHRHRVTYGELAARVAPP